MKRLSRWIGCCLLVLAFALFTAIVINPMRLGGVVLWGGKEDGGRYFVVAKPDQYTEVSEIEYRIEQYLEWCSFLPVLLVWIGFVFWFAPAVPLKKPISPPVGPVPTWMTIASVGITAFGAGVGWVIGHAPWTAFLGAWLAFWFSVVSSVWLHSRLSRQRVRAARDTTDNAANSTPKPVY
jgi:hypothetical protein